MQQTQKLQKKVRVCGDALETSYFAVLKYSCVQQNCKVIAPKFFAISRYGLLKSKSGIEPWVVVPHGHVSTVLTLSQYLKF